MNKNLILFLVLAAAAAIAYFILSAPTEQQAAATGGNAGSAGGGSGAGALSDPATTLGAATGGNALDGLLSVLTTTPNPGLVGTVTKLFSYDIPNVGKVEAWGYINGSGSSAIFETDYLIYNGTKIVKGTEQYQRLITAIAQYQSTRIRPGANK